MNTGLSERDQQTIIFILNRYPSIKSLYIFGSRAKGNYTLGSDLDLAIMNEGVTQSELLHLKSDFDDSDLPYMVDVVLYSLIQNNDLKEHIDRVGQLLYQRDELAIVNEPKDHPYFDGDNSAR